MGGIRFFFLWNQKKGKGKWTKRGKERRSKLPVPSVIFVKATHAKRASDRLDARTPWTVKISVSVYFMFSGIHDLCRTAHETSIFYTSSIYHAALSISSSHLQLLSFSSHLLASLVKLMDTRSAPSLRGRSFLRAPT